MNPAPENESKRMKEISPRKQTTVPKKEEKKNGKIKPDSKKENSSDEKKKKDGCCWQKIYLSLSIPKFKKVSLSSRFLKNMNNEVLSLPVYE